MVLEMWLFIAGIVADPHITPSIARAGKYNPRSIIRLLNRICLTTRITHQDPLALLIHFALDEERFAPFQEALTTSVKFPEEQKPMNIGQWLSAQLDSYRNHVDWIASQKELKNRLKKPESCNSEQESDLDETRKEKFDTIINTLDQNPHLCKLFQSKTGKKWIADEDFRQTLDELLIITEADATLSDVHPESLYGIKQVKSFYSNGEKDRMDVLIAKFMENMVRIPEGSFFMGSQEKENEMPVHKVRAGAFFINAFPVTQGLYQMVMQENPSMFLGNNDFPVECVIWDKAKEFCEILSRRISETGAWKGRNIRLRLPTEAEWEYACRAETTTRFYTGDRDVDMNRAGWYDHNSFGKTHSVGKKEPNSWGLYDMHGNVWEWCEDDWHNDYKGAPADGSAWVDSPRSTGRVIRGGSWYYQASLCRSSSRGRRDKGHKGDGIGFRVAYSIMK